MATDIEHILPDYIDGKLSDDAAALVEQWIDTSDDNRRIFRLYLSAHKDTEALRVYDTVDTEAALLRARRRIWHSPERTRAPWLTRIALAVAAVLMLVTLDLGWLLVKKETPQPAMLEFEAITGAIARIQLPDSTVVTINSGTRLLYPSMFAGESRDVTLIGEGYFDVAKDPERPFHVNIPGHGDVRVYGTRFNLEAYCGEPMMLTLDEGSVAFCPESDGGKSEFRISPGQFLLHNEGSRVEIDNAPAVDVSEWTHNRIGINHTPLSDILKRLSHRYKVKFIMTNPDIAGTTFSGGVITMHSLEFVLEALEISAGIHWRYIDRPTDGSPATIAIE